MKRLCWLNFCRHLAVSWPMKIRGITRQVCLNCGARRLYRIGGKRGPWRHKLLP